jgi:hypothetical protein
VRFVRFMGDRVVQVRIAALGQPIAVHDQDELHGYLDPQDTHEVAMGDSKPGGNSEGRAGAPPSILKPGEVAPGSSQQVQMPVSAPTDKSADKSPQSPSVDMGDAPGDAPTVAPAQHVASLP